MVNIERALDYLTGTDRAVEAAWAKWLVGGGSTDEVYVALKRYQNPDGGFGDGFEPDIGAPSSNPFAARLAMGVLCSVGAVGGQPVLADLERWLDSEQGEDGCWRFSNDVKDFPVAPWFAAWSFPSLNPALCLGGYATRLGIGSERMHARVRILFERMASIEELATAEFYELLPHVEYVPWATFPERDAYLDALSSAVTSNAEQGTYEDADHFFSHLGPAVGPLAARLPSAVIDTQLDRLAAAQEVDGGWPSPYAAHWRPWTTVSALATLRDHRRL